jgi:hypothetical protein
MRMAPDDDSARAARAANSAPHHHDPLGRATHLVFGSAAVVLGAIGRGLLRLGTESDSPESSSTGSRPGVPAEPAGTGPAGASRPESESAALLALSVVGLGAEVTRRVVAVATAAIEAAEHGATVLMQHQPVPAAVDRFRGEVTSWGERGRDALRTGESTATDLGLDVVTQVVPRVVSRLDIDAIVEQVDIGRIIDRVDLNEVVGRLDLNAIAERIDIERIVGRLDLAEIAKGVIDQLDLTSITQSVLAQLDLTAIARRVIEELELGELIRESSGTVTVEAVDALRVGGMNADRFVAQVMNKILLRRNGESHPPDAPETTDAPPADAPS